MPGLRISRAFSPVQPFVFITVWVIDAALAQAHRQEEAGDRATAVTRSARVDELLSEMTLAEKIALIHGEKDPPQELQGQAG